MTLTWISRGVVPMCLAVAASGLLAQPPSAKSPIVIVVTMDGFPARALLDPELPMPHLRALAAAGAMATAMRPINPTVTWPNHTAIITGVDASKHFVVANGLVTQSADGAAPKVEPWVDKDRLVPARTLYEAAAEKGLTTGQVDWVAIYGAKGIDWSFAERPELASPSDKAAAIVPDELMAHGLITREQIKNFGKREAAWHDQIWTDAAVDMLEKHQPNLLLLHLLQTDGIQHEYGPLTPAAYAAYAYADSCLGRVVEAVQRAGLADRTTFFILSDHGFAAFTHTISPNAGLVEFGILNKTGEALHGDAWVKAEGGAAELFIRDPNCRAELETKLKAYFTALPGIAKVYSNDEAHTIGLPAEADSDQAPQLYLVAAPDYAFDDATTGPVEHTNPLHGAHGYLNTMPEMQALFVASGAAIKPRTKLGEIDNLRVAPTIATILGLSLPDAKEEPLAEILRP